MDSPVAFCLCAHDDARDVHDLIQSGGEIGFKLAMTLMPKFESRALMLHSETVRCLCHGPCAVHAGLCCCGKALSELFRNGQVERRVTT